MKSGWNVIILTSHQKMIPSIVIGNESTILWLRVSPVHRTVSGISILYIIDRSLGHRKEVVIIKGNIRWLVVIHTFSTHFINLQRKRHLDEFLKLYNCPKHLEVIPLTSCRKRYKMDDVFTKKGHGEDYCKGCSHKSGIKSFVTYSVVTVMLL